MMHYIVIAIELAIVAVGIVMLHRNHCVFSFRMQMLDCVSEQAKADIASNRSWKWRYDMFEGVSYDAMVWQPWRRLDSFYPDKSFIQSA